MDDYKIIVEEQHQTVMAHYEVQERPAEGYQSEAQLETALINQLMAQGYVYHVIHNEEGLLRNLREQLEALNGIKLSDSEGARLLPMISNEQMTIQDKTEMLQGKGYILALTLDSGETKNIRLIDKQNIHNNVLQVINQYEAAYAATTGQGGLVANGPHRTEEARRSHQGSLQPNQPLSARLVLGRKRDVRLRSGLRHLERHRNEILLQYHSLRQREGERRKPSQTQDRRQHLRVHQLLDRPGESQADRPQGLHHLVLCQAHHPEHPDQILRLQRR